MGLQPLPFQPTSYPFLKRASTPTFYDHLQGRWKTVYTEIDGQLGPAEDDHFLVYSGNKFTVEKKKETAHEGTFTLDASHNPAQVSYLYTKSFPIYMGGPRAGLIQLEGNTLKCIFSPVGQAAPKDFSTWPGAERVLTVHERIVDNKPVDRVLNVRSVFSVCW